MDRREIRKIELPLTVAIIGLLSVLLMNALDRVRDDFEDAAMLSESAAIRVELMDRLAHHQAVGGALPESRNPLQWMERKPGNYLGERDSAPEEGGVWYYDRQREELIYRYRSGREASYRLVRGAEAAGAPGSLGGVGLRRVDMLTK